MDKESPWKGKILHDGAPGLADKLGKIIEHEWSAMNKYSQLLCAVIQHLPVEPKTHPAAKYRTETIEYQYHLVICELLACSPVTVIDKFKNILEKGYTKQNDHSGRKVWIHPDAITNLKTLL